jgi:hypothetical protein
MACTDLCAPHFVVSAKGCCFGTKRPLDFGLDEPQAEDQSPGKHHPWKLSSWTELGSDQREISRIFCVSIQN